MTNTCWQALVSTANATVVIVSTAISHHPPRSGAPWSRTLHVTGKEKNAGGAGERVGEVGEVGEGGGGVGGSAEETDVIGCELLVGKQLHKHDTCGASIMHDSQQQTYCS